MRLSQRLIAATVLVALSGALAGCCSSLGNWDPTDLLDFLDTKKKLPGERKPVFPDGVPGLEQGVPKELYKGSAQEQHRPAEREPPLPLRLPRSRNRSQAKSKAKSKRGDGEHRAGASRSGRSQREQPRKRAAPPRPRRLPSPRKSSASAPPRRRRISRPRSRRSRPQRATGTTIRRAFPGAAAERQLRALMVFPRVDARCRRWRA